jgi:hypothetical protein
MALRESTIRQQDQCSYSNSLNYPLKLCRAFGTAKYPQRKLLYRDPWRNRWASHSAPAYQGVLPAINGFQCVFRHGRACQRKSGLPDLCKPSLPNSGKPDFGAIHAVAKKEDVDARDKRGHDDKKMASARGKAQ